MKLLKAIAVVKKIRPRLNLMDIYPLKDRKEIKIGKDEKIITIEIRPIR